MNNNSFETDFATFWAFGAPFDPFRAPLTRFLAEPKWGSGHFVIVYVPRQLGDIETIDFNNFLLKSIVSIIGIIEINCFNNSNNRENVVSSKFSMNIPFDF